MNVWTNIQFLHIYIVMKIVTWMHSWSLAWVPSHNWLGKTYIKSMHMDPNLFCLGINEETSLHGSRPSTGCVFSQWPSVKWICSLCVFSGTEESSRGAHDRSLKRFCAKIWISIRRSTFYPCRKIEIRRIANLFLKLKILWIFETKSWHEHITNV